MLFKRFKKPANVPEMEGPQGKKPSVPDGACEVCPSCKKTVFCNDLTENFGICPKCGFYNRISARSRIRMIADDGTFEELFTNLTSRNIINFPDYDSKIVKASETSGENESVICGTARIDSIPAAIFAMEPNFMMGSMGSVTGEKITLLFEYATQHNLPLIGFTVSGGARMQEGIISLMQMAKTSAAVKKHGENGGLYITVLTDPTTGGVTASFAMLGDVILAEPGALIGFAGPRVIEQTIRQKLPQGFQKAEFLLEKGFVDKVVTRAEQKAVISRILKLSQQSKHLSAFFNTSTVINNDKTLPQDNSNNISDLQNDPTQNSDKALTDKGFTADNATKVEKVLTSYEKVLAARSPKRLSGLDFITGIFEDFIELHGDRRFGDDKAIVCGIARLNGQAVTVIAHEKGHDTKEKLSRNFGCAHPEGYRKALRQMKQAEKFGRPVVCFIDTSGAYCGIGAEERGQGGAIAENLAEMSALKVPVISVLIGEGGSGGALALAVADSVWMLENAVYSVISPEGCASILWKDDKKASLAAECLKMTAQDLARLNVIDKIIPENGGKDGLFNLFSREILCELNNLQKLTPDELVKNRYLRFRKFV